MSLIFALAILCIKHSFHFEFDTFVTKWTVVKLTCVSWCLLFSVRCGPLLWTLWCCTLRRDTDNHPTVTLYMTAVQCVWLWDLCVFVPVLLILSSSWSHISSTFSLSWTTTLLTGSNVASGFTVTAPRSPPSSGQHRDWCVCVDEVWKDHSCALCDIRSQVCKPHVTKSDETIVWPSGSGYCPGSWWSLSVLYLFSSAVWLRPPVWSPLPGPRWVSPAQWRPSRPGAAPASAALTPGAPTGPRPPRPAPFLRTSTHKHTHTHRGCSDLTGIVQQKMSAFTHLHVIPTP